MGKTVCRKQGETEVSAECPVWMAERSPDISHRCTKAKKAGTWDKKSLQDRSPGIARSGGHPGGSAWEVQAESWPRGARCCPHLDTEAHAPAIPPTSSPPCAAYSTVISCETKLRGHCKTASASRILSHRYSLYSKLRGRRLPWKGVELLSPATRGAAFYSGCFGHSSDRRSSTGNLAYSPNKPQGATCPGSGRTQPWCQLLTG
jgi:hypothetical protein